MPLACLQLVAYPVGSGTILVMDELTCDISVQTCACYTHLHSFSMPWITTFVPDSFHERKFDTSMSSSYLERDQVACRMILFPLMEFPN